MGRREGRGKERRERKKGEGKGMTENERNREIEIKREGGNGRRVKKIYIYSTFINSREMPLVKVLNKKKIVTAISLLKNTLSLLI